MRGLPCRGNKMPVSNGAVPPKAKLTDEAKAACKGRAIKPCVDVAKFRGFGSRAVLNGLLLNVEVSDSSER